MTTKPTRPAKKLPKASRMWLTEDRNVASPVYTMGDVPCFVIRKSDLPVLREAVRHGINHAMFAPDLSYCEAIDSATANALRALGLISQ